MFRLEKSPLTSFNGFDVKCFRQGRTNLMERRITRTHILFAPIRGVVGIFLQDALAVVDDAMLMAAWRVQGSPKVTRPTARQVPLFGRLLTLQTVPFAGYDDLWLENDTLYAAFKRGEAWEKLEARLRLFSRQHLLAAAEASLRRFAPQLTRMPLRIEIAPLRPRILGQCTRDGVIRLNEELCHWPETVMEETLAHELVHLEHFNHSPAFWKRLTELLPDWLPRSLAHYL